MTGSLGVDEFLLPMAEYVTSFGGELLTDQVGEGLTIESLTLDMPMELGVVIEDGAARLLAAPPTQHLATTFMPVFHRLRIRLEPS